MRCSVHNFKNAELLDFHILSLQLSLRKVPEVFLVWLSNYSPWDWGQNGIKLGKKRVIHQKLLNFT